MLLFLWGLYDARVDVVEAAKFLVPFTMAALTAALWAKHKVNEKL